MKALTIKQPWASLIAHGVKDIENRTWKTKYRGRIYIHASSPRKFKVDLTDEQAKLIAPVLKSVFDGRMTFGAIIGEVDIVDCVINHPSIWAEKSETAKAGNQEFYKKGSVTWNWVLANAVLYDEPILNVKGKLSFWEWPNGE